MEGDRYARYGAATGILAVIFFVVGFGIFGSDIPKTDDSAQEWASFFSDNQDRVQIGLTLVGISVFFLLWFLGSLRGAIAAAEGGTERLATIAFGGGVVSAMFFVIAVTGSLAAAYRPDEIDPNTTRALNDFALLVAAPCASGLLALLTATAIAGYRHGAFPPPVAGFAALGAVGQPFAYGIAFTDSGAFAPDGVLGLWVPVITASLALVVLSGNLVRRAGVGPAAGAPPPAGSQ